VSSGWTPDKAELVQIKPVHEYVDRTHRIVLGYVVVQQRREQCALTAIHPFHEPRMVAPSDSPENHSIGRSFHTAWAIKRLPHRNKRASLKT
jgi:hypothetical protein